jgi:hypothetical protein
MAITQSRIPSVSGHATVPGFDSKEQNLAVSKWASMVQRRLRDRTSVFVHGKDGTINRPGRIHIPVIPVHVFR